MKVHPSTLVMLDYDGTLAELVDDPTRAWPHPETPKVLAGLQGAGHQVYLVSGRRRAELLRLLRLQAAVDLPAWRVIGLHGLEWPGGAIDPRIFDDARTVLKLLKHQPGVQVEDKGYALTAHIRHPEPKRCAALTQELLALATHLPEGWEAMPGHLSVEFRPPGCGKGAAVRTLMQRHPACPALFIGDDVTDEAAFQAVQAAGGTGIKVGAGPTAAAQRVPDVPAVLSLLESLYGGLAPVNDGQASVNSTPDSAR